MKSHHARSPSLKRILVAVCLYLAPCTPLTLHSTAATPRLGSAPVALLRLARFCNFHSQRSSTSGSSEWRTAVETIPGAVPLFDRLGGGGGGDGGGPNWCRVCLLAVGVLGGTPWLPGLAPLLKQLALSVA